jgi:hypothetical protein
LKDVPSLPGSLDASLTALENDYEFLLKGDVFTQRMIDRWIEYKREREFSPCVCVRTRSSSRCITTFRIEHHLISEDGGTQVSLSFFAMCQNLER